MKKHKNVGYMIHQYADLNGWDAHDIKDKLIYFISELSHYNEDTVLELDTFLQDLGRGPEDGDVVISAQRAYIITNAGDLYKTGLQDAVTGNHVVECIAGVTLKHTIGPMAVWEL